MELKDKELYDSPTILVVEMNVEGVICGSGTGEDYEWD